MAASQAAGLNLTHTLRSRLRNKLGLRIRTFQCQEGKGMHQGDVHRALSLKPQPRHRCTVRPHGSHGSRLSSVCCLMIFLQFTQRATTGPAPHNIHELGRLQSSGPQWLSHSRVTGDSLRTGRHRAHVSIWVPDGAFLPLKYTVPIQGSSAGLPRLTRHRVEA